jgi:hypothetical protein
MQVIGRRKVSFWVICLLALGIITFEDLVSVGVLNIDRDLFQRVIRASRIKVGTGP